jgi:hypothetical protein
VIPGIPSWLAPLQALALVVNPRLGLRHNLCLLGHKAVCLICNPLCLDKKGYDIVLMHKNHIYAKHLNC